jgi:hypothetical protein
MLTLTGGKMRKVYVDGVNATIVAERVEYLDENVGPTPDQAIV